MWLDLFGKLLGNSVSFLLQVIPGSFCNLTRPLSNQENLSIGNPKKMKKPRSI